MTSRRTLAAAILGALIATTAHAEGDVEAGRYKAQTCLGCHGINAYGNGIRPLTTPVDDATLSDPLRADAIKDIVTEYGKVTVVWWTHKIGGLHRNDFVMAAKTDDLYSQQ